MNSPDFTDFFLFFIIWRFIPHFMKCGILKTSGGFEFDRSGSGCEDARSILSGTKECMGYE